MSDWLGRHPRSAAWLLLVALTAIYQANGGFLIGDDISPALKTADRLARVGEWSFRPQDAPVLFHWQWRGAQGWESARVRRMSKPMAGHTAAHWLAHGRLRAIDGVMTVLHTKMEGRWVSQYGPGGPLTALPVFWVAYRVTSAERLPPRTVWHLGKLAASLCVAGAAVFVFLIAARFVGGGQALLVALTFGLGTCAWSTSSQTLWQHGPNEFWLAAGLYGLVRALAAEGRRAHGWAAWAGFALGFAVCCRPTSGVTVVGVGLCLLVARRRLVPGFVAGGLPMAAVLGTWNHVFYGAPWIIGQGLVGAAVAKARTGTPTMFQIPLYEGACGLLLSPSRGLLVYSPVLAFAGWGAWRAWRSTSPAGGKALLRTLTLIVLVAFIPSSMHLGWWGGWSFGYRFVVDESLLIALLLIPVIGQICARPALRALFALTLAWSIVVQVIGVVAYDVRGWNGRVGYELLHADGTREIEWERDAAEAAVRGGRARLLGVGERNVDHKEYYGRLWSIRDNQLRYSIENFERARRDRREAIERWVADWD